MSDSLRFELPQRAAPRRGAGFVLVVLALLAGAGVGYVARPRIQGCSPETRGQAAAGEAALLSHAQTVSLAETLEKNQCYAEAARAWQRAAALAPPSDGEKAEAFFRIGKNLSLANRHEEALAWLFAAEAVDRDGRWKQSVNRLVLEGLSALGREDARVYQAQRRTSLDLKADKDAGEPVAAIGGEPITDLDLQTFARRMVMRQMGAQRAFMTPEALRKAVDAQLEQFKSADGRKQLLQAYISQELLYREALAAKQPEQKEVQEQIVDARRQILVGAFLDDYLSRNLHIGETDLKNAYEANKAEYIEPEAVKVEAIVVESEAARKEVSDALDAGTDFAAVREKHSTQKKAADSPDPFDRWIARDGWVPMVSDSKAALAHLLSLEKGDVSRKWFSGNGGRWLRFRCVDRRKERQLDLAECRDRVERDLRGRKQEELIKQLEQALQAKYKVVMNEQTTERRSDEATKGKMEKPESRKAGK